MNYDEATKYSMTVKWKTSTCSAGDKCWCRIIEPIEEIKDDDGEEIYIAASGCIPQQYAEHIVKIHNENISKGEILNTHE